MADLLDFHLVPCSPMSACAVDLEQPVLVFPVDAANRIIMRLWFKYNTWQSGCPRQEYLAYRMSVDVCFVGSCPRYT